MPKTETPTEASEHSRPPSQPSSLMLAGKGSALAPQLSVDDGNLELKTMHSAEGVSSERHDHDIMQLARLGDIPAIQKLYDDGIFTPSYCDDEGITPLHVRWKELFSSISANTSPSGPP